MKGMRCEALERKLNIIYDFGDINIAYQRNTLKTL